jgi:ribosome modulation factor
MDRCVIEEGRGAFHSGQAVNLCPYREVKKRELWLKGWYEAHDKEQSATPAKIIAGAGPG